MDGFLFFASLLIGVRLMGGAAVVWSIAFFSALPFVTMLIALTSPMWLLLLYLATLFSIVGSTLVASAGASLLMDEVTHEFHKEKLKAAAAKAERLTP